MTDRLVLVLTSARLPPGLLTWPAWAALHASPVCAGAGSDQVSAVSAAGVDVTILPGSPAAQVQAFRQRARPGGAAVWLAGPDDDPQLLAEIERRLPGPPAAELAVIQGSWDPPGAHLLDAVAVMDRLRSPGGCPWDAEQTHTSLMPYLLEESYEAYTALEEGDLDGLREELGDVLLQVLFHARLAQELPGTGAWGVDDVSDELVDKLVRRHPHVFAGTAVSGPAEVLANWEQIKTAEKSRTSVTDGIALSQPALTLAATLLRKAEKAGIAVDTPGTETADNGGAGEGLGRRLMRLVVEARASGQDAEVELRRVARELRDAIVTAERRAPGRAPG